MNESDLRSVTFDDDVRQRIYVDLMAQVNGRDELQGLARRLAFISVMCDTLEYAGLQGGQDVDLPYREYTRLYLDAWREWRLATSGRADT